MNSLLHNPIALIFLSYALGAVIEPMIRSHKIYHQLTSYNLIGDKLTKNIGVLLLGKIIKATPLRFFNTKLYIGKKPKRKDLVQLKQDMDAAEVGHLIGFVFLLLLCVVYFFIGKNWKIILAIFLCNIFLGLYLVFLQQYNKRRIIRFLNILDKK